MVVREGTTMAFARSLAGQLASAHRLRLRTPGDFLVQVFDLSLGRNLAGPRVVGAELFRNPWLRRKGLVVKN